MFSFASVDDSLPILPEPRFGLPEFRGNDSVGSYTFTLRPTTIQTADQLQDPLTRLFESLVLRVAQAHNLGGRDQISITVAKDHIEGDLESIEIGDFRPSAVYNKLMRVLSSANTLEIDGVKIRISFIKQGVPGGFPRPLPQQPDESFLRRERRSNMLRERERRAEELLRF